MRLTKLEMYGFKSFARKTEIVFDDGITAIIGTNGSGKTTILKHITGIIRPDSGSITLDGRAIYENTAAKQRICFVPDDLFFFGNYNLNDMRRLYAGMYQK